MFTYHCDTQSAHVVHQIVNPLGDVIGTGESSRAAKAMVTLLNKAAGYPTDSRDEDGNRIDHAHDALAFLIS